MTKIKVLNLYAGIGGNRKLWNDEEVEVTAVDDILQDLEDTIEKGNFNLNGHKGFRASLWVSNLKKKLQNKQ